MLSWTFFQNFYSFINCFVKLIVYGAHAMEALQRNHFRQQRGDIQPQPSSITGLSITEIFFQIEAVLLVITALNQTNKKLFSFMSVHIVIQMYTQSVLTLRRLRIIRHSERNAGCSKSSYYFLINRATCSICISIYFLFSFLQRQLSHYEYTS